MTDILILRRDGSREMYRATGGDTMTICPRCRGSVLRGECLNCGFDTTIDRAAMARQIAEDGGMTAGAKITYADAGDALRRHARERLERKAKRVKA